MKAKRLLNLLSALRSKNLERVCESKMDLDPQFLATIRSIFGSKGDTWLSDLPALLKEFRKKWGLTLDPPFPDLSFTYVAPAQRKDGSSVVLKLGVPNDELTSEIDALRIYAGRGAVRLLESEADQGALLLERLQPGTMLSPISNDEQATRIAASVMEEVWRPEPVAHHFKTVADWAADLDKIPILFPESSPIPQNLTEQARSLFADLLPSQTSRVVLHGDLHHFNILSSGDRWLAIDPKGIIGEPEFEPAAYLENKIDPYEPITARKITEKRIAIFCEMLGFDRKRVRDWTIAHSILSTWWLVEDFGLDCKEIAPSLAGVEIFRSLQV